MTITLPQTSNFSATAANMVTGNQYLAQGVLGQLQSMATAVTTGDYSTYYTALADSTVATTEEGYPNYEPPSTFSGLTIPAAVISSLSSSLNSMFSSIAGAVMLVNGSPVEIFSGNPVTFAMFAYLVKSGKADTVTLSNPVTGSSTVWTLDQVNTLVSAITSPSPFSDTIAASSLPSAATLSTLTNLSATNLNTSIYLSLPV